MLAVGNGEDHQDWNARPKNLNEKQNMESRIGMGVTRRGTNSAQMRHQRAYQLSNDQRSTPSLRGGVHGCESLEEVIQIADVVEQREELEE